MEKHRKAFRQIEEWRKEISTKESKHINNVTDKNILLYLALKKVVKCSVQVVKTGEHCPEKPTKEINRLPVCDKCYDNWVEIIKN